MKTFWYIVSACLLGGGIGGYIVQRANHPTIADADIGLRGISFGEIQVTGADPELIQAWIRHYLIGAGAKVGVKDGEVISVFSRRESQNLPFVSNTPYLVTLIATTSYGTSATGSANYGSRDVYDGRSFAEMTNLAANDLVQALVEATKQSIRRTGKPVRAPDVRPPQ